LCGDSNQSFVGYYRKFDKIGVISLNDWYVLPFQLKNYDEQGNEMKEETFTNMFYGIPEK